MTGAADKFALYLAEGCGRCPLSLTPDCKAKPWRKELEALRAIILDCGLTEDRKWGVPCYMFENTNVLLLSGWTDHCDLSFLKGVLLRDPRGILQKPGENSQSARLIRFTNLGEIVDLEPVLKAYILEAVEAERAGLKVDMRAKHELVYPEELQQKLDDDPAFRAAFEALTPGRQRGYNMFFSAAKQSKTRTSRIEKCVQQIFDGKGLHD